MNKVTQCVLFMPLMVVLPLAIITDFLVLHSLVLPVSVVVSATMAKNHTINAPCWLLDKIIDSFLFIWKYYEADLTFNVLRSYLIFFTVKCSAMLNR
jgi:hypothetical protein